MKKIYNALLLLLSIALLGACSKVDGSYKFENKESLYSGNTLAYLKSKPGVFDSLVVLINRMPYLNESLSNDTLTLFAPTNSSFQIAIANLNLFRKSQNRAPLYLRDIDLVDLDTMLNKYLTAGLINSDSMYYTDGLLLKTLNFNKNMHVQKVNSEASGFVDAGLVTVFYSDTKNSNFQIDWVRTSTQAVNIRTANGVVHILNAGHEFGFGDFLTRFNK